MTKARPFYARDYTNTGALTRGMRSESLKPSVLVAPTPLQRGPRVIATVGPIR